MSSGFWIVTFDPAASEETVKSTVRRNREMLGFHVEVVFVSGKAGNLSKM
jgi:hypothetical protein